MDPNKRQYPKESSWIDGLRLGPSRTHGQGVFTTGAIPIDSVVIKWGGVLFTEEDVKSGKAKQHTYVGIGVGLYLANPEDKPLTLDDYMNHSCDGNIWMRDEVTLVSRRDIAAGEELMADYALWLNSSDYCMKTPCNCNSQFCRRIVTGLDWQLPDVQGRYAGHFSPFINKLIEMQKQQYH